MNMKKSILSSLLLASSFLLFQNGASASEQDVSSNQPLESTEEVIHFDATKQEVLITDEFIIRALDEDELNSLKKTQSLFDNRNENLNLLTDGQVPELLNGVWDELGYETVFSRSNVWASNGGDYRVLFVQDEHGPVFYRLKEEDEGGRSENVGGQFYFTGADGYEMIWRNISSYVDGDNGLAEFFIDKQTHTSSGTWMAFYD